MSVLSICIPTYNRREIAYRCALNALRSKNKNIEVVICDNGSNDGTYEKLSTITDNRLRLFQNAENMGGAYNFRRVLKESKSKFAMLLSDEDILLHGQLDELIACISNNKNISAVLTTGLLDISLLREKTNTYTLHSQGFSAYVVAFQFNYLSGMVYNTKLMDYEIEQCTLYPSVSIAHQLALKGNIIKSDIATFAFSRDNPGNPFYTDNGKMHSNIYEAAYDNTSLKKEIIYAYFEPSARLTQFKTEVQRAMKHGFNECEMGILISDRYYTFINYFAVFFSNYTDFFEKQLKHNVEHYNELLNSGRALKRYMHKAIRETSDFIIDITGKEFWQTIKECLIALVNQVDNVEKFLDKLDVVDRTVAVQLIARVRPSINQLSEHFQR